MKKLICLLIVVVIGVSLVACGNQTPTEDNLPDENGNVSENNQPAEDESATEQEQPVEDESEIEIKIDFVAEKLGLIPDESEVWYHLIGAVAGKQYNDGNIELYQFDENSQAYKDLIGGNTYLPVAAYKDGVVLVFALGVEKDQAIVDAFNSLDF